MSHVDDGILHAYLDGEATPVERGRLEGHLASCAACRARLEEERALMERAARLLGLAAPPERPAPSLHELRRPRRGGGAGYRLPLTWAATVALAIGIGWYARGLRPTSANLAPDSRVSATPAAPAPERPAVPASDRATVPPAARGRIEPRPEAVPAPPTLATESVDRAQRQRQDEGQPSAKTARDARGAAAPSQAAANVVLAPADAPKDAELRRSAAWPLVEPGRARELLGAEPVTIPGLPIRALRSNPNSPSEIVVEQLTGPAVVLLFERRSDSGDGGARSDALQRGGSNERLARYVRSLRIEISGALSADSLSALLDLIR
jgi:hypothetical protein